MPKESPVEAPHLDCPDTVGSEDLEHGTWIVVLRADRIPHVVLLQDGVCFSLEHDGNRRYTARKLWRLIEARRIPALLCELGPEAHGSAEAIYGPLERIQGDGDCFFPVRDYCAGWFPACAACLFPYELIPLLARAGKLARAATLHLQEERATPRVVLPTYSREEIRARIAEVRATIRAHGSQASTEA